MESIRETGFTRITAFAFFAILAYHSFSMAEIPFTLEQQCYLAEQVGRRVGRVDSAWAGRLANRFRKKFAAQTTGPYIRQLLEHFRNVFIAACYLLPGCVHPPESGEISLADVDQKKLLAGLQAQFPQDDEQVLDELMGWAIIYDYLH
jgi:hypothetical protein